MDRRLVLGLLLLAACKAQLGGGEGDDTQPDAKTPTSIDAAVDGQTPLGPWGTPARVSGADSTADEDDSTLNSTRTELYFKRNDAGDANLYVMMRSTPTSPWGAPQALGVLNSTVAEESPRLSSDDLTLYFGRNGDIYKSTRTAVGQPWQAPTAVTSLNTTTYYEKWAAVCSNGYAIVSRSTTNNSQDLFEGTIAGGANTPIAQFNSVSAEQGAMLTNDCLRVYFQSNRSNAQFDIYTATRTTVTGPWTNPTVLTDFNTATYSEEDPWISADQRTFVFSANTAGNKDVYISTR